MRAELVQGSVEHSGCGFLAGEFAVHVEANSTSLVPRESEMDPLIGFREVGHRVGDAGSSEIDVGDKGVEAMAVVVDSQPDHVPAGVIAVANAKDGELSFSNRFARTPVEGECSALGVDVAGGPVGEQLVVAALEVGALRSAGKNFYVFQKVGGRIAASGVVGVESVVAGEVEEETGLFGGFGGGQHCAGEQAECEE